MRGEDCGRVEVGRIHSLGSATGSDERSDLFTVRSERKPDDGSTLALSTLGPARVDELAHDGWIDERPGGFELVHREPRPERSVCAPRRELGCLADLVPDPNLTRLEAQDPGERSRGERSDLRRVAQASQIDEESGEPGKIEDSRRAECRGPRRERSGQGTQELQSSVRDGTLGVDVEHADRDSPLAERQRDLAGHRRRRLQVIGIRLNVDDDLPAAKTDGATHDSLLHSDAVRHDGVPALGDEPETSVLEDEDGRKHPVDRLVECIDCSVDRPYRVVGRIGRAHRLLDCSSEQARIERPQDAAR